MAGITLVQAEEMLAACLAAEKKILLLQESTMGDKRKVNAALRDAIANTRIWEARVKRLSRTGGLRIRQMIPL